MYNKEWNKIKKELDRYLPEGVSIQYEGHITDKFPQLSPICTDPDYIKGFVFSIRVGPFNLQNQTEMNLCLKQLMDKLSDMKYDVEEHPFGYICDNQNTWYVRYKKPFTYLYLTDDEEWNT